MKANIDTYQTILKQTQGELYKDKNSKFYGYAFPVDDENTVKQYLEELKKKHHSARHWCYAYLIGTEHTVFRANDDGEPNNSAGMPIYGQIQSFGLTNVLVVVVRYFGGVKLGLSALVNAYKTGAQLALSSATIIEKTINKSLQLKFEYKNLSKVLRLLKENNAEISKQVLELDCLLEISVRKSNYQQLVNLFENFYGVETLEL